MYQIMQRVFETDFTGLFGAWKKTALRPVEVSGTVYSTTQNTCAFGQIQLMNDSFERLREITKSLVTIADWSFEIRAN